MQRKVHFSSAESRENSNEVQTFWRLFPLAAFSVSASQRTIFFFVDTRREGADIARRVVRDFNSSHPVHKEGAQRVHKENRPFCAHCAPRLSVCLLCLASCFTFFLPDQSAQEKKAKQKSDVFSILSGRAPDPCKKGTSGRWKAASGAQ